MNRLGLANSKMETIAVSVALRAACSGTGSPVIIAAENEV